MLSHPHLIHFTGIGDQEVGFISVAQSNTHIPFEIKRVYWVYQTPEMIQRGNHAHKLGQQVLIAMHGKIEVQLETIDAKKNIFILDKPSIGLFIPINCWRTFNMSADAVLLCLSSIEFDESDYIREYKQFKSLQ
jgi:hypothetical protein